MKQKQYRRSDFDKCPACGGILIPSENQSECIHCRLTLTDDCCYTIKGNKIEVVSRERRKKK